jgi:VanZ family protein
MWAVALFALLAAAIDAVLSEFYQSFVPSRTASARDVAIDLGGALTIRPRSYIGAAFLLCSNAEQNRVVSAMRSILY